MNRTRTTALSQHLQPWRALPLTALAFIKALTDIGKWLRLSDLPQAQASVPMDYFGINIAPSDDSAVDDYLLERVSELAIGQVRMDFSYDSLDGPAQRLLERVLGQGLEVMLEIFPPLDDAKVLYSDPDARTRWGNFLDEVFSRYQDRVSCFEIGSTPNRGRWSGFSVLSYQTTWAIAVDRAANFELVLAGPNVSDFEPLYNASFLSGMSQFGRSPQIHTDNLFVERVIEPEAYDHRVFGRLATNWLKLNLPKKARILEQIGQDNGCPVTICTYKCWTTKRLARRSAWPDQKRVDYLVRYLALAASSGALRRVYWGPLVCARDGLISDQVRDYPVIDQVTYYQRVRGPLADFQITSAFYALGHAVRRFSGATCNALVHQPNGLSVFKFSSEESGSFVLCWSRDRMNWPLAALFTTEQLDKARFLDACGEEIPRPAVVDEQPLFIEFERDDVYPREGWGSSGSAAGITQMSSPEHRSIGDTEGSWVGACMLRARYQQEDLAAIPSLRPSILPTLEETAVLRDARNRIWNIKDPRGICDQISVKLNRVVGIKRLSYRFRPSKGQRHWNNACEMLRRGVRTPLPVAFYEQREKAGIRDSWYLCEFIPGAFSARDVYATFNEGGSEYRGLDKLTWFRCLAEFVCEMHNKQIVHRDLSTGNLMIRQREDGVIEPLLIDIGRAWLGNGAALKERQRLQDLMRICYKLNWPDRASFIGCYESHMGSSFSVLWRLPFHYYDYKQKFKKGLKSKLKKISAGSGKH